MIRRACQLAGLLFAATVACSCTTSEPTSAIGPALRGEPIIRVRILRDAADVLIDSSQQLRLICLGGSAPGATISPPVTITRRADRWLIDGSPRDDLAAHAIEVAGTEDQPIRVNQTAYPHRIVLVPDRGDAARFDVVNHVHLERYLPGVLDRELYDDWALTTYQAQAIAARSYAIYQILHAGRDRHFDVESTQASQAYAGLTAHTRSLRAVLETTGLVLTYADSIIPAYYHSTSGGAGASPTDAWGAPSPYPPLAPQPRPPWDADSPHFQWGPIQRDLATLRRRFIAWGNRRKAGIAKLGYIREIKVAKVNAVGRPARFAITDHHGKTYTLNAEAFRTACNFSRPVPLDAGKRLKSAYVRIELRGDRVVFRGRGFGHGVGLSQFGAQAMASAGRDVMEILQTYYPGAAVQRAY